jgi:hypothetical protein
LDIPYPVQIHNSAKNYLYLDQEIQPSGMCFVFLLDSAQSEIIKGAQEKK